MLYPSSQKAISDSVLGALYVLLQTLQFSTAVFLEIIGVL